MRLGFFGGAFDPVHAGHVAIATAAQISVHLDRIVFVPSAHPPHRQTPQTAFHHRVQMLRLALAEIPWAEVSEIEATLPSPTYTLPVIQALAKNIQGPIEWFLILGSDNYEQFKTWNRWEELLAQVHLVVYPRKTHAQPRLIEIPATWLESELLPEAASNIRQALRLKTPSVAAGLLPSLHDYVRQHGLYRAAID